MLALLLMSVFEAFALSLFLGFVAAPLLTLAVTTLLQGLVQRRPAKV